MASGTTSPGLAISAAFGASVAFVIDRLEGGDRQVTDTGGLTRFGISKRAHPRVDVETLTRLEAMAIYHASYWTPIKADCLPRGLDLLLFDAAVNLGPPPAVRLLQEVLGVGVDGIVGPETIAAVKTFRPGSELRARFNERRERYYSDLAASKPVYKPYLYGWRCRLFRVADEAGRLGGAA